VIRVAAALGIVALLLSACASASSAPEIQPSPTPADIPGAVSPTPQPTPVELPRSFVLPAEDGAWTPPSGAYASDKPTGTGTVRIDDIGEFAFDASQVATQRPDIFQPGHFSVFDALVRVAQQGDVTLEYHFDETLDTHVIDAINGESGWWYIAYYAGGWSEFNVFRMDMFPYKNGTYIRLYKEGAERLASIYRTFEEEVARLERNGGQVIIPEVTIRSSRANYTFRDVVVTPHKVRSDVLQPGVVTALDALLSLGEQGELPVLKLTWYDRIGSADPVQHYFVERIGESEAYGSCGFVYETGPQEFAGFRGTHIHIPSDLRVTVSPEYALWFWICL
jgi:hypothetical protein